MKTLQKIGGLAALYLASAYIIGMIGFLAVVDISSVAEPVDKVALMAANQSFLYVMHLVVYVAWGVVMVVLSLALYERLKNTAPAMMQTATVFGIFWGCVILISGMIHNAGMQMVVDLYFKDPYQASTIWMTIEAVLGGLAGSNEAIGGIWILLLSAVCLRAQQLPRFLNWLGALVGAAGLISVIPALDMFIFVFALGQIVWFIWLGISMLQTRSAVMAQHAYQLN